MASRQVRLTVMIKKCFAFGVLHKEGEQILKNAVLVDEEEKINGKNPPKYAGFVDGFVDIPLDFFRIEEVSDDTPIEVEPAQVSTEGTSISHRITKALGQLNPEHDGHWTTDGSPRLDQVIEIVGEKVTRAEVEFAEPGFNRESAR